VTTARESRAFDGLAVLGDSISTGAAANPTLEFDSKLLWDVFTGQSQVELTPELFPEPFRKFATDQDEPILVKPSVRENDGGSGWLWQNLLQAISARTIEERRLSYGYFVGRELGIPSKDILIVGENGARSRRAWVHASRLLGARQRDLPSKILLLYSGNDLCAQSYDDISLAEDYGDGLLKAMKYLVLNGHVASRGTRIYLPAFLPVISLMHEQSILDKKINLHGEQVTCREAREQLFSPKSPGNSEIQDPRFQVFSSFIPPSPVLLCPTLFSPAAADPARQSLLANRLRAYREAQKKAVQDFNEWRGFEHPSKSFEAKYIDAPEQIRFDGDDVAGDCFHLSAKGQSKVAAAILTGLR
jgi:hypothetical protein